MLTERQEKFLEIIIREYIKRAEPVSSSLVLHKSNMKISSATVRNDLMFLESEGYIFQPHVSAGRIPSDKAYHYFLQHFFKASKVNKKCIDKLSLIKRKDYTDLKTWRKAQAKELARLSDETILLAFDSLDVFYTGISNLFKKTEFQNDYQLIQNLSALIDHLDEVLAKVFYQIDDEIKIYLGDTNPFHSQCAAILTQYETEEGQGIIGILGPKRMDYEKNIALLLAIKKINNLK